MRKPSARTLRSSNIRRWYDIATKCSSDVSHLHDCQQNTGAEKSSTGQNTLFRSMASKYVRFIKNMEILYKSIRIAVFWNVKPCSLIHLDQSRIFETSVPIYQITRIYMTEDSNLDRISALILWFLYWWVVGSNPTQCMNVFVCVWNSDMCRIRSYDCFRKSPPRGPMR